MKTLQDFKNEIVNNEYDSVGKTIAEEQYNEYASEIYLRSCVGKTVQAIEEYHHSGAEYFAGFTIRFTDGTAIHLETQHGPTYCFTDFSIREV